MIPSESDLEQSRARLLHRRNNLVKEYKVLAQDSPQLTGPLRAKNDKLARDISSTVFDIDKYLRSMGVQI